FDYDYLIIASGSETNFYGNENLRQNAYKVDNLEDVAKLINVIKSKDFSTYFICGGGYTGIEVATNLSVFLKRLRKKNRRVIIVEHAPSILGPLPEWMKEYTLNNLKKLDIEVFLNNSVEKVERGSVFIYGGKIFEKALLIWAAGVKTAPFIQNMNTEKNPQGRIKVNSFLRLKHNCFVVGDAAYFSDKKSFLRMAVMFSIYEGRCAAENILRSIEGKEPKSYKPLDLGYVIPMANNKSCGVILGLKLKGFIPTVLHFVMCSYRSYGIRNKLGLLLNFIKGI
ncbi:MAG: FAD-dependent oxidoreductase, partial [Candidatus Omnitrophota bacterium]